MQGSAGQPGPLIASLFFAAFKQAAAELYMVPQSWTDNVSYASIITTRVIARLHRLWGEIDHIMAALKLSCTHLPPLKRLRDIGHQSTSPSLYGCTSAAHTSEYACNAIDLPRRIKQIAQACALPIMAQFSEYHIPFRKSRCPIRQLPRLDDTPAAWVLAQHRCHRKWPRLQDGRTTCRKM